jgi:beta-galactosidase
VRTVQAEHDVRDLQRSRFERSAESAPGANHLRGLGYSRPGDQPRPKGGATSDHWIDLEKLTFEPTFQKYVRDAFNPVGLMLDFWAETVPAGTEQSVKLYVINDIEPEWKGELRLLLLKGTDCISTRTVNYQVQGFRSRDRHHRADQARLDG